ncbi:hypothetical protein A1O3_04691 [Capronia epimyces CBS 606.96]|uniref:Postreplication repair E3 ubiquitin-protein ligase RAD18 n=1 Tax=Capronia epimyces CBS 606.96 TaxID=1182542 RepID=W9YP34_9EURO|nr:uncharacterized protein A1O3_04691 [Capronia epimyces CBS 606.96]EXJ84024.1 hypothetical protein A1O3_04691 [Capronia epimyces CBS 606.96]
MPEQYEFADSTDWLPTPLAALAPLESSLRCQVCKDFFTTPMMTSCSHTFCSLCIRRYLSQEGRCPACREPDQEVKLRRNWVLEELVANFTVSRKRLLDFARSGMESLEEDATETQRPKKRRKVEQSTPNGTERRSTRSQSKKMPSSTNQPSLPSTPEVIEDSEEGSVYEDVESQSAHFTNGTKEPDDGLVACPCCHRRMKENLINSHLDKCISGNSHTPVDDTFSPAPQIAPPGTIAYAQVKRSKQNDRLPFINYSLLTDNALRKKLRDLGIPSHGSKDLMRRRHTEWVNLWNANCDSTNPVTKRQLLQELKVWEDTLGRQSEKTGTSGFMAKDFDSGNYVKNQKSNFDDLIRQARQKRALASNIPVQIVNGETPEPPQPENTISDHELRRPDLLHLQNEALLSKPKSDADEMTVLPPTRGLLPTTQMETNKKIEQQTYPGPTSSISTHLSSKNMASQSSAGTASDQAPLQSYMGDLPEPSFSAYAP